MNSPIVFIFRKRLTNYNSIEELFGFIQQEVSKINPTRALVLKLSGASPLVLLKNLMSFTKNKNEIHHITGDVHYMALVTGRHTVLTIHDVKSATQGNFLKQFYIRLFWFWLPALFVKRITVISEFTNKELAAIIPFAKGKIRVVHNPVHESLTATPFNFNTEKPHVLLVGTKANKNLERSCEALKNIVCKLTIIGQLSSNQHTLLTTLDIDYESKTNLSFDEVIDCYKNCDLVCFPSTYEGFGMPIIEAQAIGRPVLTSEFGAMLEVAGNAACLVDSYDVEAIRTGILKICNDSNYRQDLIHKGFENVKRFQVSQIVEDYRVVYNEVLT